MAHESVGAGTYGVVIKPALPNVTPAGKTVEFPNDVTKVFYDLASYKDAMKALEMAPQILGKNEGRRFHTYHKRYTLKNENIEKALPKSVRKKIYDKIHSSLYSSDYNTALKTKRLKQLKQKFGSETKIRDRPLFLVRMPDLGVDISSVYQKKEIVTALRSVPIPIILGQVKKLLEQTRSIADHGYIHTDVRETNVMVNPATGIMTLIDFDWLKPVDTIYKIFRFGFYNNPPETLLLSDIFKPTTDDCKDMIPPPATQERWSYHTYIKTLSERFNTSMKLRDLEYNIFNTFKFDSVLKDAICDTRAYIKEKASGKNILAEKDKWPIFRKLIAPTFDNFGLGLTLLELFLYLYPGCLEKKTVAGAANPPIEDFIAMLKPRISDGGRPYTDEELAVIAPALRETASLFHLLSSFYLRDRPEPAAAVEMMEMILQPFARAGAAAGSGAAGGYRVTRRRTRRRKA
jgi:hypothetical protein